MKKEKEWRNWPPKVRRDVPLKQMTRNELLSFITWIRDEFLKINKKEKRNETRRMKREDMRISC